MQKSTKRLLSWLVVLALVLTCAPGGFLAVETKADDVDYTQTNWDAVPDTDLSKTQVETEQAKQTTALEKLALLAGETAADRAAELPTVLEDGKCPFCEQVVTEWLLPSADQTNFFGTGNHYYIYGSFKFNTETAKNLSKNTTGEANAFLANAAGTSCCILMDGPTDAGADVNLGMSRILQYNASTLNVGGKGTMYSSMGWVSYGTSTFEGGLFSVTADGGEHELNLYGGTFYHTGKAYRNHTVKTKSYTLFYPVVYSSSSENTVNIWTDNVIIGPESVNTTNGGLNLYVTAGQANIYGGTLRNAYCLVLYKGFNVFVKASGVVNMYDGTVTGGRGVANSRGANVYVEGASKFNMYGGEIKDGLVTGAYSQGGNISAMGNASAVVNIAAGKVEGGKAPSGGNINIKMATLKIGDKAGIIGATTGHSSYGGNIYLWMSADGTTIDGTITGGRAINGGNIYMVSGYADISANISEGVGRFGSNVYAFTKDMDGAGTKTEGVDPAYLTFSGGYVKDGVLDALGATAWDASTGSHMLINTPTANGGTAPEGVKLTLKGDFDTDVINFVISDDKNTLTFDASWSKEVDLCTSNPYYINDTLSDDITAPNGLHKTAKVKNLNGDKLYLERQENGLLKVPYADYAITDAEGTTTYTSAEDAVTAYTEGDLLVVASGKSIDIGEKAVTLDVIGTGNVEVTGSGIVSGIDRHNRNFDNNTGSITATNVAKDANYNDYRYIALKAADGKVTFHRIRMVLTTVSINANKNGLSYKGDFYFDDAVAAEVKGYGTAMAVGEGGAAATETPKQRTYQAVTLTPNDDHKYELRSHTVANILKADNTANVERADEVIWGRLYVDINTGFKNLDEGDEWFVSTSPTGLSLNGAIAKANDKWSSLSAETQNALVAFMYNWYAADRTVAGNEAKAWDATFIDGLKNIKDTFKAYVTAQQTPAEPVE